MKVLYIGTLITHEQYKKGIVPSHWLYGAVEMEKDGHEVVWSEESNQLINDWRLVRQHKPDYVFIHNLNMRQHILLSLLRLIGIVRVPVYGFLHHTPKGGKTTFLYKLFLKGITHVFFLSEKTMTETISQGYATLKKCSVPGWGPDKEFFDKVPKSQGKWFVSTGKENRDFDVLIEAFKQTGAPLKIMTAKSHAGNSYEDLAERCKDIPNIEVIITENTGNVYPQMLKAMANARALVCPLRQDKLNYCVGLSTIADAIGLAKPVIITGNPYHDARYADCMHQVVSVDDWVEAIRSLSDEGNDGLLDRVNMQQCYQNMEKQMML